MVAPGGDADLVVWDPSRPAQLSLESIDDALDWTPYGGIDVPGTFRYVLARGDRVVEDGRYVDTGHRGAYLPAARPAVVR